MIHQRENSADTELFLKSNGQKFTGDCLMVMKLLYQGYRLSSKDCWERYSVHDRRLRNCYQARPDIVKREWKKNEQGKRMYVEYWIDVPKPLTKSELQAWWDEYQNELPPLKSPIPKPTTNLYPNETGGKLIQGVFF